MSTPSLLFTPTSVAGLEVPGGSEVGYSDYPGWSDTRWVSATGELEVVS